MTVLASMLAHELTHVDQSHAIPCLDQEAEAYVAQAEVWRALWPDHDEPRRTRLEQLLYGYTRTYEEQGRPGVRQVVERAPRTSENCRRQDAIRDQPEAPRTSESTVLMLR